MTYIIAEPCIDIKDRSCVDVCPVDCIHEGDRILVIDPEECIDCFAPTELFFTPYGLRSFGEMENRWVRVLTDDGFKPAYVRRFRRKPLVEIELAPAFEERDRYGGMRLTTRNISRFRRRVEATSTHSWVLADGQRTDSLSVGDFVPAVRVTSHRENESYRLGVLHGLVFGDGHCEWVGREEILHHVPLFGDRVAKYKDFFDEIKFQRWYDVHPGYTGTGVVYAPVNLKRNLPADGDAEYIAGFLDGWLAADGDPVRAGSWRLRSIEHEALDWLASVAPLAGYVVVGSGQESNMTTKYCMAAAFTKIGRKSSAIFRPPEMMARPGRIGRSRTTQRDLALRARAAALARSRATCPRGNVTQISPIQSSFTPLIGLALKLERLTRPVPLPRSMVFR